MNRKKISFSIVLIIALQFGWAQKDNATLFTVNDETITVKEFKRVYQKNLELVQEEEQKDVASYLDLYIDYKLKVQEAYRLGLDKNTAYKKEFDKYRKQLSKGYLTDVSVTDALIEEVYHRTLEERNARHILVQVKANASPEDTLKALAKINEARDKIVAGASFIQTAKQYSEDPSAKTNGGELGWFKAFRMVYPFETAAYATAIGEVSLPFRTQFGYHIVQPTASRQAQGRIKVAHIMVALRQSDSTIKPEQRIQEINSLITQGSSFEELAKQYSDDKRSADNGGVLLPFEQGQLSSKAFEEKSFSLAKGERSAPFKTEFGWHIVKLLDKFPVGSLKEEWLKLEDKLKKDARAKVISDSLAIKLRAKYAFQTNPEIASYFTTILTDAVTENKWKVDTLDPKMKTEAFSIRDMLLTYEDFGNYLAKKQFQFKNYPSKKEFALAKIKDFEDEQIKKYHEAHLEEIDQDFALVLREYREGLLLFDLMQDQIWNKAKNDSLAVLNYFNTNKNAYTWPERLQYTVGRSSSKSQAQKARQLLAKGQTVSQIEDTLNKDGVVNILFSQRTVPLEKINLPKGVKLEIGLSQIVEENDYSFYNIDAKLPVKTKSIDEARGEVISDYQAKLEEEWLQKLRANATIKVNKKLLSKLEKSL